MLSRTTIDKSDSEDYVLPADDYDSDSADELHLIETATKIAPPETDALERKKQRDALWASFQVSVSTPPPNTNGAGNVVKRIKIEKTYLFAGKHVARRKSGHTGHQVHDLQSILRVPLSQDVPAPPMTATVTTAKRPGPRKPRTGLPSIPKGSQAKKITTIDKCAMDWRSHVASQSSDVKDELDANRRGGGYLEKVEFLKRMEDRREDAFEASKSSKRRRT